jgi:hypothetical protein
MGLGDSYGSHLEYNGRECCLVVAILVSFWFCLFAPVFLVCFQGLPQPGNDVGLEVWHHGEGKGRTGSWVMLNALPTVRVSAQTRYGTLLWSLFSSKEFARLSTSGAIQRQVGTTPVSGCRPKPHYLWRRRMNQETLWINTVLEDEARCSRIWSGFLRSDMAAQSAQAPTEDGSLPLSNLQHWAKMLSGHLSTLWPSHLTDTAWLWGLRLCHQFPNFPPPHTFPPPPHTFPPTPTDSTRIKC